MTSNGCLLADSNYKSVSSYILTHFALKEKTQREQDEACFTLTTLIAGIMHAGNILCLYN